MTVACAVCTRPFATRNARAQHERRAHPDWQPSPDLTAERRREVLAAYRAKPERQAYERQWRADNGDRTRTYHARYRQTHRTEAHERTRAYKRSGDGRRRSFAQRQRDIAEGKHSARMAVLRAAAKGLIERKPCEVCEATPVEGHHYLGYAREHWLDVQWLCRQHHEEAHHGAPVTQQVA